MNLEKPVIATDVDGILVKWQSGLPYFAQKYNLKTESILELITEDKFVKASQLFQCDEELANKLMEKYNNSDFIRYLSGYSDAIFTVNRLAKDYDFVCVTALGTEVDAYLNRRFNLNALFPGVFDDIRMCNHNESKQGLLHEVALDYGDRVVAYIDDLPHHIDTADNVFSGKGIDAKSIWMPRNTVTEQPKAKEFYFAETWFDVESIIES